MNKKAYALLSKKHPSFLSVMRTVGETYGISSDLKWKCSRADNTKLGMRGSGSYQEMKSG